MRLGIDARFYAEPVGIGRYVREIITHLERIDVHHHTKDFGVVVKNEYVVFLNAEGYKQYQPADPRFKKVLVDVKWYTLKEQLAMSKYYKQEKVDLMFFPHWNIPLWYCGKFVLMIHDLIMLKYPSKKATTRNWLFFKLKYWVYKLVLRRAVQSALKIIAPSEFVKQEVAETFDVPSSKIEVICEGVSTLGHNNTTTPQHYNIRCCGVDVLQCCGDHDRPYMLYVGQAFPHKNLETLIEAFKIFNKTYSKDYRLVLAGKENYFYHRLFNNRTIEQLNNINFMGYIPDVHLATLYQNASLYIFPSLSEGFGLPPLEAMAHGVPVASSNASCLPEILGQSAYYFDPHSPVNMADAMWAVLSNKNLQAELREKGYNQIKKYSWEKSARETLQVFMDMV